MIKLICILFNHKYKDPILYWDNDLNKHYKAKHCKRCKTKKRI